MNSDLWRVRFSIVTVAVAIVCLSGCRDSADFGNNCVPGEVRKCQCPEGTGAQTCGSEGAFGSCRCGADTANNGDGRSDAGVDAARTPDTRGGGDAGDARNGDACGTDASCDDPSVGPCQRAEMNGEEKETPTGTEPVDEHVLDKYSGARAAYSLRRLRSDYQGPAIRVRRESDGNEQDIGFADDGWIDVEALEQFVGDGDGFVTTWYAQVEGTPDMTQSEPGQQPYIARGGSVERDVEGNPTLYIEEDHSLRASGFDEAISLNDYTMWGVIHSPNFWAKGETEAFGIGRAAGDDYYQHAVYRFHQTYINTSSSRFGGQIMSADFDTYNVVFVQNNGDRASFWQGNTRHGEDTDDGLDEKNPRHTVSVGGGFVGTLGEMAVYPSVSDERIEDFYANVADGWDVGPAEWNRDALLPQQHAYQVTLYDWIEGLSVEDLTLPEGDIQWNGEYENDDQLADLWLRAEGLTASSVTRAEPAWYMLDAGDGRGIEATGSVRIWHEPKGSRGYGGNPPRSWANEPALLYDFDVPLPDGSQGNPYYHSEPLGRRALVVAMVDMMMHHANWNQGATGWYDMFGKAALSWAETYRATNDLVPTEVREAFETGMAHALDRMIEVGPRAVNSNMDTFAIQAQAIFASAVDDPALECKANRAARDALFGHTDGGLGGKHDVFAAGDRDGGIFDPSGFIMEGDQPDVFYGGESIYHMAGALTAVTDRETGEVAAGWDFLKEVVRRLQAWRTYQMFYDPGVSSPGTGGTKPRNLWTAGAGFSGRTGYGVPAGQAGKPWKYLTIAGYFPQFAYKGKSAYRNYKSGIPDPSEMTSEIEEKLSYINGEMASNYDGKPGEWSGWSPWAKPTPYLPPKGWYSDLRDMKQADDPRYATPPAARAEVSYNKKFGGPPVGDQYWAFKDADSDPAWGFFVEAQARQGGYGGWYGGKIETFWTEATGVVLVNRHGKTGCDDNYEDSVCWGNLDKKAGHHVWGRDENANGFTTLLLRGRELTRTSTFDLEGSTPTVSVDNVFNDPSLAEDTRQSGEKTGTEIQGEFEVKNTFAVQSNGLKVTHELTSDESDQVTELWASLPVYLRHNNPKRAGTNRQANLEDTSIEYRDGGEWKAMPDGEGTPQRIETEALRLGRDFKLGEGTQYAYVIFEEPRQVRLSEGVYYDPYQSKTGVRTVHIDLHGNPGSVREMPANETLTYTIQTEPS